MKSFWNGLKFSALVCTLLATVTAAWALGETCDDAYPIGSLPFTSIGTTVGRINDYDEPCSFLGPSSSPDVVYHYVPSVNGYITITLCEGNTDYYTRMYVYQDGATPGSPYACNDFACSSPVHDGVSRIGCLPVYVGHSYCIVIDGRNDESGNYQLDVFSSPCTIDCQPPDIVEPLEPTDSTNFTSDPDGGCNLNGWGGGSGQFGSIACGQTVCGRSFTFTLPSDPFSVYLDMDWYRFTLLDSTEITATLCAAFQADLQIYSMTDCSDQTFISETIISAFDTTTVTTPCLGAGSYAFVLMPAEPTPSPSSYRLSLDCPVCGTPCEAADRATVFRAPGDSVSVRWRALQTVGTYKVWVSTNPQNDGNPDGGADPNWTLAASVPGPAVAPFNMRTTLHAVPYANFVVVHDCTPVPPANDNCQGSFSLSDIPLPIVVHGNTSLAANDYTCQGLGSSPPPCWLGYHDEATSCTGPDLVYDWIVPAAASYTISLCGSDYDTGLLIYNYTCPSEPTNPADYICGNDDLCGSTSEVSGLQLYAGQHILIVVDGWAGSSGAFTLTISQP